MWTGEAVGHVALVLEGGAEGAAVAVAVVAEIVGKKMSAGERRRL